MEEKGFETINDFCGKALPHIFRHNDLSRAYKLYSQADPEKCVGCKACMKLGCPAISVMGGKVQIDNTLCTGCGLCCQLCRKGALGE